MTLHVESGCCGICSVRETLTTLERGSANQLQKKTTQALDGYGNLVSMSVYGYGELGTPVRTYVNTYLSGTAYTLRYIRNRLLTSTVTGGGSTVTLVSNSYDGAAACNAPRIGGGAWQPVITGPPVWDGIRQHDDANYPPSFTYRGNLTVSSSPGHARCMAYNAGGVPTWAYDNGVEVTSDYSAATNWSVPSAMTTNTGLTESLQWNSFLGLTQETGANGETAGTAYDSYARPSSVTGKTGVVTTFSYASAAPWTVTATTKERWTKKTLDGFGRVVKVESGTGGTTLSVTETEYDACGCSPVGKTKRVSMPYAPAGQKYWTVYNYDALGRTVSVVSADGSSTKRYEYVRNTVKVTDEAGKWKKYWMDALGNLVQVEEPKPAADTGHTGNYFTSYTYDVLGHLTGVQMTRGGVTQTRTFHYGTPPGAYLLSATNPESGTAVASGEWRVAS